MGFVGGALGLTAAIVSGVVAFLPKENPAAALPKIGGWVLNLAPMTLTIISGIFTIVFDLGGVGFWFFAVATFATFVNFVRTNVPIRRLEVVQMVLHVAILVAFGLMLQINHVYESLVRVAEHLR